MSDPDVRPFFGEEPEVLGEWSVRPPASSDPRRAPIDVHLDARIAKFTADGVCAMCMHDLDEDGVCATCGFNPAAPRTPKWTPEQQDDYMERLPDQMLLEEYAPAEVDAA